MVRGSLQRYVIHRVEKAAGVREATTQLSNAVAPPSTEAKALFNSLDRMLQTRRKAYGVFTESCGEEPSFEAVLSQYIDNDLSFLQMTKIAVESLFVPAIEVKQAAKGGYVAFFENQSHDGKRGLVACVIDNKNGTAIDVETLTVKQAQHIDIDSVRQIAVIDISAWQVEGEENYIVMRSEPYQGKDVRDYFRIFLGCEITTSPKKETGNFVHALDDFCATHPKISTKAAVDVMNLAQRYLHRQSDNKKLANLDDVSSHIFKDYRDLTPNCDIAAKFSEYANSPAFKVSSIFEVEKTELKQLTQVLLKSPGIKISTTKAVIQFGTIQCDDDCIKINDPSPESISLIKRYANEQNRSSRC